MIIVAAAAGGLVGCPCYGRAMRRTGFVDAVDGLGRHDHVCWVFESPGEFRSVAQRFLADGLSDGQRVIFIGDSAQGFDLDSVEVFAAARASGAAQVQDIGAYGAGAAVDPAGQVRSYAQATEQALLDGYTGLRVAADVTSMVGTVDARTAFARYEHLIDVYMTHHPFAAMCGYRRDVLGAAAVAELAGMHPLVRQGSTALRLFAADEPGVAAVLAGQVDMTGHAQLRHALDGADLASHDGAITIDARDLDFIDHRGLIQLVEHIRGRQARAVLQVRPRSVVPQLANLLELPDLQMVMA